MTMSTRLIAAVADALRGVAVLEADGVRVFDAPPVRAHVPFAQVVEPILADWSTKERRGFEARIAVRAEDAGERPERLRRVADAIADTVEAMPRVLAADADADGGWELGAVVLVRSRLVKRNDGRWVATIEFRMRVLAMQGDE